ncbi:MAG: hypothetical protein ABSA78_05770 [Candidatus Sulfotelmatobacter sp.]|jgi:hypothetical protein
MSGLGKIRRALCMLFVLASACAGWARTATTPSSATLLLEEPYGKLGFFTATGHAAVYLSGVCAETPLLLRRCAPGEFGAVISRYDGVGGYDWVAIPLIPYLYAVEKTDDIPLFADPKLASFLRDRYRRKYLEAIAPDLGDGATPGGNWYELVGSAYDRTAYGFQIETTSAQDEAFIRAYNASPNRSHFHITYRNCADFAKDVINFYYPKALHRSVVADVGITTPKQMAQMLIKFSARHPQLELSRFVIPQIPGSEARSTPVHGVVESFLKSKKYIVPSAMASPIFAGCVVAVYVGTGGGRLDPAKQALVFNAERELEPPLGSEDRRSYQSELNLLVADPGTEANAARVEKWRRLLRDAVPDLDAQGRPIFYIRRGEEVVSVGVAPSNILASDAPEPFTQELLEARLHSELRRGNPPKASESDVTRDWNLLQKAMNSADTEVATRSRRPQQIATDDSLASSFGSRQ